MEASNSKIMNKLKVLKLNFYSCEGNDYKHEVNSFDFNLFDNILREIRQKSLTIKCDINTLKLTKV